jgi:hypothetical protein
MEKNLSFHETLNRTNKPITTDESWDKVMASHKEQNFKAVITGILNYVDPELIPKYGNADQTEFKIWHGSVQVQINISATTFKVTAPFLDISESKKIPLLRKVTELNFSPLNLAMIVLQNNQLVFQYECPLTLCEPYKTYEVLREICIYADSYDDEFISKFDAKWIQTPSITPLSNEKKEEGWKVMQLYISEALEAVSYFETKRALDSAWDILAITLMKLEYFLQPQGLLRIELEKTISYLTGNGDPMPTKISRGKSFLNKLKEYNRADFDADLYSINTFIPYKIRSNTQGIKNNGENAYAQSKKEMEDKNYFGASMTLMYQFFNLFYNNNVPNDITALIEKGLKESSGQTWPIAAEKLFKPLEIIMKGEKIESTNPDKKKGFFQKLFGN